MDILRATGARKVLKRAPKGSVEEELGVQDGAGEGEEGLVFGYGGGEGEKEGDLVRWESGGWGVYKVEMLTMSILRGALELGEEFVLTAGGEKSQVSVKGGMGVEATPAKGKSAGGRRKSGK